MKLHVTHDDLTSATRIRVVGALVGTEVLDFELAVLLALAGGTSHVVVDLARCPRLDGDGLAALVSAGEQVMTRAGWFEVDNAADGTLRGYAALLAERA